MATNADANLAWQNFYQTTLSSNITSSDTTIPLTSVPTVTESFLVIDPDSSTNREIIFFNSKTGSAVVCPTTGDRGRGGTTAASHTSGTTVRMATVGEFFSELQNGHALNIGSFGSAPFADGWVPSGVTPSTVTANGNRSYTLSISGTALSGVVQPGHRLKTTRTVAAPTQCTSLNGTTQYYSKTSPAGMTFTDDYTAMGWIKLTAYGTENGIIGRRNADVEGWSLGVNSSGQLFSTSLRIASNNSQTVSYQSIPLNKWVHVAASTDLSGTSVLLYIDGVLVPSATTITGTITALVQGTSALTVGALKSAGTSTFTGKIAQAAVYSAVLSAATIQAAMNQTLAGTETSLISAYSFNNTINDLNTTNANNLTANGSAVATNADSPFGGQSDGTISSTLDYAIVQKATYSGSTTLVVQVPEGCTIPTSGGVSAISYSNVKAPYGFPAQRVKWKVKTIMKSEALQTSAVDGTWYNVGNFQISAPIGEWAASYEIVPALVATTAGFIHVTLSTANNTESDKEFTAEAGRNATESFWVPTLTRRGDLSLSAAATYYLNLRQTGGSTVTLSNNPSSAHAPVIVLENAYL